MPQSPGPFADRLNRLFEERSARTGSTPSLSEFLTDFEATTGTHLSKGYLSELRNGVSTDPRLELLRAFARYFGVPAAYFLEPSAEDAEYISAHAALDRALHDAGATQLGLRAAGLSSSALRTIANIIDNVREMEGLASYQDDGPKKA